MKKIVSTTLKILIPLLIAALILYFTYRNYDFSRLANDIKRINWHWLAAALAFSAFGPLFRGLRWNLLLEPIGHKVPRKDTVLTVFTGYATNIVIPRVGEVFRCSILERNAGVPFSKGLGTLVAERVVDAFLLVLITLAGILSQFKQFKLLINPDNTSPAVEAETLLISTSESDIPFFRSPTFLWIIVILSLILLLWLYHRKFHLGYKIKNFIREFKEGFLSLRHISRLPLFIFYSIGIWVCYYLELYLAFYSLPSTAAIGPLAGFACFAVSNVAVLIPTPNGAGPWNFAIVKMLGIYGVPEIDAQPLSLVLHSCQTIIYLLCGLIAWIVLKIIHHFDEPQQKRTVKTKQIKI